MTPTISRILVPVDFSDLSAPARVYAANLARLCGAKLYFIHVIEDLIPDEEDLSLLRIDLTQMKEIDHRRMERAKQRLFGLVDEPTRKAVELDCIVRGGKPFDAIVQAAEDLSIDLIVMTTHGRTGLLHMILGSTAENIIRTARCPVLTIRSTED